VLGSEAVSCGAYVWAVQQPQRLPQLPSGGNASANITVAGLFTALPLAAAPVLVWNRSEACNGVSEYRQQGTLVSPFVITVPRVPGYSLVQLLRIGLDGWAVCRPAAHCLRAGCDMKAPQYTVLVCAAPRL